MNNTTLGNGALNGASREKNWNELTSDEKLERMRQIIKSLSRQLGEAQASINHQRECLCQHSHSDKGIVVPWNEYPNHNASLGVASLRNEDYF